MSDQSVISGWSPLFEAPAQTIHYLQLLPIKTAFPIPKEEPIPSTQFSAQLHPYLCHMHTLLLLAAKVPAA